MASRNADSMTNAQGEFTPSKPRDEPLQTSGHQVGQKVTEADNAPEFHVQTLPAGTAPPERTFQPDTTSEVPGQADNENVLRSHGKEGVQTSALDSLPGATSADVHQGYGHPGQGQTSTEIKHGGQHTSKKVGSGYAGVGAAGGTGLFGDDDKSKAKRDLESDHTGSGPRSGHGVSLDGAESKLPVTSEEVAADRE